MEPLLEHSFRNFHANGVDYLCLKRTPQHTVKLYFFDVDMDVSKLPEVVMPHDHRYDFSTVCIAGEVQNREQAVCAPHAGAERYDRFRWDTPLLDGKGFTWAGAAWLTTPYACDYFKGDRWSSKAATIHTLQIKRAGTIIQLDQFQDIVPVGQPTSTFRLATETGDIAPPELAGLYDRMTEDHAAMRMRQYKEALANG